jgi:hypothetical protein
MTDNTQLSPGSGGDVVRDIDRGGGIKTQVMQLDVGGASSESLVSTINPLPMNMPLVGIDTYNSSGYLNVDSSSAGTDGSVYSTVTFPQVNMMAGKGIDGIAHAMSVSSLGTIEVTEGAEGLTVNTSVSSPVDIRSDYRIPQYVSLVGDPNGDFAEVNILEKLIENDGQISLNTQVINQPARDINNKLIPSDAPQIITGSANAANQVLFVVDTTGYQSISLQTTGTWVGTISLQSSNDGINWLNVLGWNTQGGNVPIATFSSNIGVSVPATLRYFRAYFISYTSGTCIGVALLRQQPAFNSSLGPSINVNQIGGTAVVSGGVAGIQAIGGNIAIGTTATANPVPTGGRVLTTLAAAQANAATASLSFTGAQQLTIKPYGDVLNDWAYTTGATALTTTTTAAAAKAAGAAGIRNYVTGIQAQNTSATATTLLILDGATNLLVFNLPASMTVPAVMDFPTPLHGTAATALNYNFGTAAATVFLNIQGYQSA